MSWHRPPLGPRRLDDGRTIVSRRMFIQLSHRGAGWVRRTMSDPDRPDDYCEVLCDVLTRGIFFDLDKAEEVNKRHPQRKRDEWTPLD